MRADADEHDDPSWPGLVDIFAFTMVIMVFLMAYALREKTAKQVAEEGGAATINNAAIGLRNSAGDFKVTTTGKNELTIEGLESHPLSFSVNAFDLEPVQVARLERIADALGRLVAANAQVLFFIDGRADPQEFHQAQAPRDNTDLSALRAAFVAKTLVRRAPTLERKLRVVGLGVEGEMVRLGTSPDVAAALYAKYRRVSIRIVPDTDALLRGEDPVRKTLEDAAR